MAHWYCNCGPVVTARFFFSTSYRSLWCLGRVAHCQGTSLPGICLLLCGRWTMLLSLNNSGICTCALHLFHLALSMGLCSAPWVFFTWSRNRRRTWAWKGCWRPSSWITGKVSCANCRRLVEGWPCGEWGVFHIISAGGREARTIAI